jgi:hypothetical protein
MRMCLKGLSRACCRVWLTVGVVGGLHWASGDVGSRGRSAGRDTTHETHCELLPQVTHEYQGLTRLRSLHMAHCYISDWEFESICTSLPTLTSECSCRAAASLPALACRLGFPGWQAAGVRHSGACNVHCVMP